MKVPTPASHKTSQIWSLICTRLFPFTLPWPLRPLRPLRPLPFSEYRWARLRQGVTMTEVLRPHGGWYFRRKAKISIAVGQVSSLLLPKSSRPGLSSYEQRTKPITSAKGRGWNGHRFFLCPLSFLRVWCSWTWNEQVIETNRSRSSRTSSSRRKSSSSSNENE